ncbi:hypothetical protein SO802_020913 [Lithocarpus litseifolius]|uniref:Chaoptin n=1 Tax=Lithocarpus litseifolius TaxID=425828 RepID=A0AAW2CFS5_9ROSI
MANHTSLTSLTLKDCGLHELGVLILRYNQLQGTIGKPKNNFVFPNLLIVDFSYNNITDQYTYSMAFTNKGIEIAYKRIPYIFIAMDLSSNKFEGEIPELIGNLKGIQLLNLSNNLLSGSIPSSLEKLTALEALDISQNKLSGEIPPQLTHLTFLAFFNVSNNHLIGPIPSSLFRLANLQRLILSFNDFNQSRIPVGIRQLSNLTYLDLRGSGFAGQIPAEIFQLSKLVYLDLSLNLLKLQNPGLQSLVEKFPNMEELYLTQKCNFSGPVPSSFGNLTKLIGLDLSYNNFNRGTLDWIGKQTKLIWLGLAQFNLNSSIPLFIQNLTQLTYLNLDYCNLRGHIPSRLANLTRLAFLGLKSNGLDGSIPSWIYTLMNLETLDLSFNYFGGVVEFDIFLKLQNLHKLQLSSNLISLRTKPSKNITFPKFRILGLGSCDLHEFPDFLKSQDKLELLILSNNKITSLTGFHQLPVILPWTNLRYLDLSNNKLQGSLPIPPPSISSYLVSNNTLTVEIPQMICNLSSLVALDLSYNNLSGMLPDCLGNLSFPLTILNLRRNNFHGNIPQICKKGSKLKMIDFSRNQLQGRIPRSLVNCTMLETLVLGNNQLNDSFPFWLGVLPELGVLILRYNQLQGAIGKPESNFVFPNLHIIDFSYNNITGKLPFEYFQIWKAMQIIDKQSQMYMQENMNFNITGYFWKSDYTYSMTFTNRGIEIAYERIPYIFIAMDLSSNKFEGEIPKLVGNLKGIQLLNLSNNLLTGSIPSSLEKLRTLEALDLSQNKLSGEIPPQLTELTFLAFFNVSNNYLIGPIPHGKQFDTFLDKSFGGNPGLCGSPLSTKCENFDGSLLPPLTFEEINHDSKLLYEFGWKVVLIGSTPNRKIIDWEGILILNSNKLDVTQTEINLE